MRSSLDYAGFALYRSAQVMLKIMRVHNHVIPPSLPSTRPRCSSCWNLSYLSPQL